MIDFLKNNKHKSVDHPLLNYVKGMLPDCNTLTPKRQRRFKQKIGTTMNDLMDEQEMEHSSTPPHSTLQFPVLVKFQLLQVMRWC